MLRQTTRFTFPSLLFLLIALPVTAQYRDTLPRAVEFQVTYGASANNHLSFSPEIWNQLTPDYPNPDAADTAFHHTRQYSNRSGESYAAIHLNVSLKIRELEVRRLTPMLGFTIGSAQGAHASVDWWKSGSYRVDTLNSSQNGAQYYVDSVVEQHYSKRYVSNQYFIGSRLVLQTNRRKRISGLFGIQLSAGVSSYSWTEVSSSSETFVNAYPISQSGTNQQLYHFPWNSQVVSVVSRKPNWYYGFTIPIGMDVRLGKRDERPLGKMTVGMELAAGATWIQLPGIGVQSTPTFNFGFTYKYRFQ